MLLLLGRYGGRQESKRNTTAECGLDGENRSGYKLYKFTKTSLNKVLTEDLVAKGKINDARHQNTHLRIKFHQNGEVTQDAIDANQEDKPKQMLVKAVASREVLLHSADGAVCRAAQCRRTHKETDCVSKQQQEGAA